MVKCRYRGSHFHRYKPCAICNVCKLILGGYHDTYLGVIRQCVNGRQSDKRGGEEYLHRLLHFDSDRHDALMHRADYNRKE